MRAEEGGGEREGEGEMATRRVVCVQEEDKQCVGVWNLDVIASRINSVHVCVCCVTSLKSAMVIVIY